MAYLEIYGVTKGALSADLEPADSERGPTTVRGAMRITGQASDDLHLALGGIPIGSLSPRDIVVRAVVSLDGKPIGRVVQTLRKAKPGGFSLRVAAGHCLDPQGAAFALHWQRG